MIPDSGVKERGELNRGGGKVNKYEQLGLIPTGDSLRSHTECDAESSLSSKDGYQASILWLPFPYCLDLHF